MAIIIDEEWLKEHGVDVEGRQAEDLIDMTMDELELRTGMEIAGQLTDRQIEEFEKIADEDARVAWLDNALPEYPTIVDKKAVELGDEIRKSKDKIALIKSWEAN